MKTNNVIKFPEPDIPRSAIISTKSGLKKMLGWLPQSKRKASK